MKTILHIFNSNHYSGLEKVACDIILNTNDEYREIYITKDGPIIKQLKKLNIEYYVVDKISIANIKKVLEIFQPDIIHAHDYRASCIAALSTKNIPILSHLHNNSPWIKTLHPFSFLYLYCSRRFEKILIVSNSIKDEYIFSKFIENKIQNIGNPLSRKLILDKINKNDEKEYDICCVARLTKQKNPLRFIKIIDRIRTTHKSIKTIWVGEGELLDNCKEETLKLGLDKNIKFLGFKENPFEYMNKSKVLMLTSDWEGFGLVAFEALTLGLPCYVSNVGGLPTIVDGACGALCDEDNDFLDCIDILDNNDLYKKKSVSAIKKSKKLDNYDGYMMNIRKIYKDCIRNR